MDMPLQEGEMESCEVRVAEDPNVCQSSKAELLFLCAKTCGFCDEQGLFCEDYYIKKCDFAD